MNVQLKKTSTISSWLLAVVRAFESYGQDSEQLLSEVGIDKNILRNPELRIKLPDMTRVWELAVQKTGDPCFGLSVAAFVTPTTFHALGFAMMASSSLNDMINRFSRNHHILTNALKLSMDDEGDIMTIRFTPVESGGKPAHEAIDALMAAAVTFYRTMITNDVQLLKTEFVRPEPEHSEKFTHFFKSPILFSASHNQFFVNKEDFFKQFPAANIEIARYNEEIVKDYLNRFQKNDIVHQVDNRLNELIHKGPPSLGRLARSLGLSKRNLNRYLENENTSYNEILKEIRQHLALKYFKQKKLSITDIAFKLGYTDSSNFARAFKRWFGITPKEYRGKETKQIGQNHSGKSLKE